MAEKQYFVIFELGKGSAGAYSPDFPGCISVGDNLEEAKKNIVNAIEFYLEDHNDMPARSELKAIEGVIIKDYKNKNIKVIMPVRVCCNSKK